MVRRSAPILLGLVVCLLFAVHPSGASSALRLDESKIRVSLAGAQTRVSLEVESGEPRPFGARVTLALLDPSDKVRAEASSDVSLRSGKNPLSVQIKLPYSGIARSRAQAVPVVQAALPRRARGRGFCVGGRGNRLSLRNHARPFRASRRNFAQDALGRAATHARAYVQPRDRSPSEGRGGRGRVEVRHG